MLLYPTVGRSLDLEYVIQGHRLRVLTVDLAAEWPSNYGTLLRLLEPVPVASSGLMPEAW